MTKREAIIVGIIAGVLMLIILFAVIKRHEQNEVVADTLVDNIVAAQTNMLSISSYTDGNNTNNSTSDVKSNKINNNVINTGNSVEPQVATELCKVNVKINGKNYIATLYNNQTAKELIEQFPFRLTMSELNGNEKYSYLSKNFTENKEKVNEVKCGDIMLYGTNCLVIFYKDFTTTYNYTKIGRIDNPEGLEDLYSVGNVDMAFSNLNNY